MNELNVKAFYNTCDLGGFKRTQIESFIRSAESSEDISHIRQMAYQTFAMIVGESKAETLLTSVKDFNLLELNTEAALAGIHVFRTYFAHLIQKVRRLQVPNTTKYSRDYDESGIAVINDFLPDYTRIKIIEEIKSFPIAVFKTPGNVIYNLSNNPSLSDAVFRSPMKTIVFDCLAFHQDHAEGNMLYAQNTFVQKLHNKKDDGDIQKVMHSDTFFPCVKWWYFPEQVRLDDGPFVYAPVSNKLTEDRLQYTYEQSVAISQGDIESSRTYSHVEGSLRINQQELAEMGISESSYAVPANTLIIANVFGFHRRGDVKSEAKRNSIHGSIRINHPFT
jgi:hypothetical protein